MRRSHLWLLFSGIMSAMIVATAGLLSLPDRASGQASFGAIRDWIATSTMGGGQRDFSLDLSTTIPRLEGGRSVYNGFRIVGSAVGTSPTITACVGGTTNDTFCNWALVGVGNAPITATGFNTDGHTFYDAITHCTDFSTSTTMVATRVAANDPALRRTATAAETHNIICRLPFKLARTTASKGIRLDSFDYVFQNTIAALTTHALTNIANVVYADSTANAISGITTSGTLATTSQATPQVAGITISNPVFYVTQLSGYTIETQAVLTTNGVYTLYGINARYSMAPY